MLSKKVKITNEKFSPLNKVSFFLQRFITRRTVTDKKISGAKKGHISNPRQTWSLQTVIKKRSRLSLSIVSPLKTHQEKDVPEEVHHFPRITADIRGISKQRKWTQGNQSRT